MLCAAELLGAEGPAEAGTAAHAMAAVETAAEGLVRCSYLVDPEASPVAAAAAALLDAVAAMRHALRDNDASVAPPRP